MLTINALSGVATAGNLSAFTAVRNVTADNLTVYLNGTAGTPTADTTTGSLSNALPLRIGARSGGGQIQDFEFVAAAVWRRALTANEIATIVARYGAA